ncbi:hypothetical protein E2C01_065468 [Portunus trituberculatus]|uniref:Uncharacterized protein n=1 Tax=Portunus trituberculatus TaxID=210409 RepID=A0A5B7HMN4_PORTR|nr:hypothetical protein [Portunus trituberculatus]
MVRQQSVSDYALLLTSTLFYSSRLSEEQPVDLHEPRYIPYLGPLNGTPTKSLPLHLLLLLLLLLLTTSPLFIITIRCLIELFRMFCISWRINC